MSSTETTERFETIVIGGGQAGLTVGYHLAQRGRPFVILDGYDRVGDAWRRRWDSLRLFTPARFSELPGLRFPAPAWSFPTKDDMADYLEEYATRFELPVRTGILVDRIEKTDGLFVVAAAGRRFEAENVVVATGAHHVPVLPAYAAELRADIVQMHSSDYRNPSQLQDGDVLLVGAGNSGAEIAYELASTRRCLLAGRSPGQIPVRHGSLASRPFFRAFRFFGHRVLRVDTPIGRKLGSKLASKADPLIRRREKDLARAGVERVPRVAGVQGGQPLLEDGRALDVANVIWCTGSRADFSWIELPVFDDAGRPIHYRGVVESEPGLYFVGLRFQYSLSSEALPSRGRDAAYIADRIATRGTEASVARPTLAYAGA